jgi:hypothetical protein
MTIFETAYYDVSCKKKKNKNKIIASAYVKLIIIKIVPVKFPCHIRNNGIRSPFDAMG